MLGCAQNGNLVTLDAAIVTDNAAQRCPPVADRDRKEFRRWVAVPAPDAKTEDGADAYSIASLQSWVDAYDAAEYRKNRAGQRLVREYDRCRGVPSAAEQVS